MFTTIATAPACIAVAIVSGVARKLRQLQRQNEARLSHSAIATNCRMTQRSRENIQKLEQLPQSQHATADLADAQRELPQVFHQSKHQRKQASKLDEVYCTIQASPRYSSKSWIGPKRLTTHFLLLCPHRCFTSIKALRRQRRTATVEYSRANGAPRPLALDSAATSYVRCIISPPRSTLDLRCRKSCL